MVTVTRSDLTTAQQAIQSTHAAIDFIFEHRNKASPWHEVSNYLVMLSVKNTDELKGVIALCEQHNIAHTKFYEPDLDNQLTAIAIEPSLEANKLVSRIPLMFKNK